jgi:two-component system, NarL family, sensor kinase
MSPPARSRHPGHVTSAADNRALRAGRRLGGSPVTQFAVSGLVVVTIVAVVGVLLVQHISRNEALRDAEEVTRIAGEGVVAPAVEPGVLRGDPRALARLGGVVRRSVLHDPVVRVKLWDASGRILYSDERRLIGERFALGTSESEVLRTGAVRAELSDLTRPENRFEAHEGPLREVYLGIPGPDGHRLLFETYEREGALAADSRRVWQDVVPVVLGLLIVLWLVQIPLGWSLSARLRRGQREREALLRQAVTASEDERRRLARDLHDGVVQDLVAVSLGLGAARAGAADRPGTHFLRETGGQVRQAIRQLRTLLVELYPDDLHRQGLDGALSDLLAPLQSRGMTTSLTIDEQLGLDRGTEAIVFRTAQEALRNVAAHAAASTVSVSVRRADGRYELEIVDDGQGFQPPEDDRPHLGLRMLDDLAREHGGWLSIRSTPGRGTRIHLAIAATA